MHCHRNSERVRNFHHQTVLSLAEMLAAAGMSSPKDLKPWHISRRVDDGIILTLADMYSVTQADALLKGESGSSLYNAMEECAE